VRAGCKINRNDNSDAPSYGRSVTLFRWRFRAMRMEVRAGTSGEKRNYLKAPGFNHLTAN
jgi:hypothetical protein